MTMNEDAMWGPGPGDTGPLAADDRVVIWEQPTSDPFNDSSNPVTRVGSFAGMRSLLS
jgi:hypothetical protein